MKKVICFLIVFGIFATLAACGTNAPASETSTAPASETSTAPASETSVAPAPTSEGAKKIGLGVCHMADAWAIGSYTLVQDELKERGYDVTFANYDWEVKNEVQALDTFKSMGLDLFVTQPTDEDSSRDIVEDFIATSGVPVITVAVAPDYKGIKGFVGWNTWDAGYMPGQHCAEYIKENLDGKANVVLLSFYNENCITRQEGFVKALDDAGIDYTIKFEQNFEGSREKAVEIMENIIQADPDFDVVWAAFDGGALGARSALEAANHKAKVWSSGGFEQEVYDAFDSNDPWFAASYIVAPDVYGGAIVEAVDRFFAGETELGEIYAPCEVGTIENYKKIWGK